MREDILLCPYVPKLEESWYCSFFVIFKENIKLKKTKHFEKVFPGNGQKTSRESFENPLIRLAEANPTSLNSSKSNHWIP